MPLNLQDLEQKLKDSGALPYLLSGGAGALAGGYLASRVKNRGEGKLARLGRILATGALSGGATAGAHKLLNYSVEESANALPINDVSPEQDLVSGKGTRLTAAGLTAAGIAGSTHRNDSKAWSEISKANEDVWGPYTSAGNFRENKRQILGAYADAKGNNVYKSMLDDATATGKLSPEARAILDNKLKALGINSSSHTFKALDPFRSRFLEKGDALSHGVLRGEKALMGARNAVLPVVTKLTGRSLPSMIGRGALLGAAMMYPEIAEGVKNMTLGTDDQKPV